MLSSSIQAALDNPYGKSKKAGEDLFFEYSKETGAEVYVYRFPNVFGKWCRPKYNSAVATFCNNIAHDLPITVNDRSVNMQLVYIDDVVSELIDALSGKPTRNGEYCEVPTVHRITLGEIVDLIMGEGLMRIRNLGKKTENEIKTRLLAFGYAQLSDAEKRRFFYDLLEKNAPSV